jgi:uncharacterized membrane protein HdeD (DUF308 family)
MIVDALPLAVFFLIGGIVTVILYVQNRKKQQSRMKSLFMPEEFSE